MDDKTHTEPEQPSGLSRSVQRQKLLADVAQLFLNPQSFDTQIEQALQWMGQDAEVSRIYIFEDSADGLTTTNTYEWCNLDIEPQIQELQEVPYEYIPSWNPLLDRDGRIFSTDIHSELPEDILAVLGPQGIKSILILPLQKFEKRFGFIGFDECTRNRHWSQDDLELLRSLAGVISSAFERNQIRTELSFSEIRLSMALENSGTGWWDWNLETQQVTVNSVALSMLGLAADAETAPMNMWKSRVHPEDLPRLLQSQDDHLHERSASLECSFRMKTEQGYWKWVLWQGKIVSRNKDGEGSRMLGTQIDIDKQKKIEEDLRHLNTSKDLFFTVLAHDLKAPLLSIMQMAASTRNNSDLSSEDWRALLLAQENMAKNSLNLLENLFHWAGFQQGSLAYFPEEIDATSILQSELKQLQQALDFKFLKIELQQVEPVPVFADAVLLGIVFRNLLHNAIKFSHKGGSIRIHTWMSDSIQWFEVSDEGLGIPPEFSDSLLNESSFHTSFGTNKEHGSGIGLKICKKFIEQQGGRISFHSSVGQGSTFTFSIPIPERTNPTEVRRP